MYKYFICALVSLAALAIHSPASASIDDCLAATCRISSNGSVGTGCAFEIRDGEVRILTNYHVAEGRQVNVQFYDRGHSSAPLLAASRWYSYHDSAQRDMNVVSVPVAAFGGYPPKVIPLGEPDEPLPEGQPIVSAGCEEGRWPSAWKGHVVSNEGRIIKFLPKAIPGRSGSAIFDEDGERIVGLIAWHDGTHGVGMTIGDIHAAFAGKMPAMQPLPTRPVWGKQPESIPVVDIVDLPHVADRPLSERRCIHGVSLVDHCQFCGPGGCQPILPRRQQPQQPYGGQGGQYGGQQQGNGGAYPTRPPDEGAVGGGTLPDLSKYATKDDLAALEAKLIAEAKSLLGNLPDNSEIKQRLDELESSQGSLVSVGNLKSALDRAKADILGNHPSLQSALDKAKADLLGNHPTLASVIDQAKQDVLAQAEGTTSNAVGSLKGVVIQAAEQKALSVVNTLVVDKLAGLAGAGASAGGLGALGTLGAVGGPLGIGLALGLTLLGRSIKSGLGGAASKQPFPGQ